MKRGNEDDLTSEFEPDSEVEEAKRKRQDLTTKTAAERFKKPERGVFVAEESNEERKRSKVLQLDAYSRHKKLINDYLLCYAGSTKLLERDRSRDRTDIDVIRENHRFVWDSSAELDSWEKRLAKKYYDKLFKEYCIVDLSRYKDNAIALRWRVEKELIAGKGQFVCGNKKCEKRKGLTSWEVNFGYVENDRKLNTLVKLRLCPECSAKLNYRHMRKQAAKKPKKKSSKTKNDALASSSNSEQTTDESNDAIAAEQAEAQVKAEIDAEKAQVVAKELWSKPPETEEEKSREDEFEEFLEDMLL